MKNDKINEWCEWLKAFMEQPSTLIIFLLISYVDLMLGSVLLSGTSNLISFATVVFVRNVILYLQTGELILQLVLFQTRFFSHWGYCFDTLLVVSTLGSIFQKPTLHLLGFLKVWRFLQVCHTHVMIEVLAHDLTKGELQLQTDEYIELKRRVEVAERNKRLTDDEVSTLKEALTLAAMDVAAAKSLGSGIDVDVVAYTK